MLKHYSTENEIEEVVQGFEACTTLKGQFTHREHLTVATWYLSNSNADDALDRMRAGLFRFLDHHGVGRTKYKEELTVTWMTIVGNSIAQMEPNLSLVERTNNILDRLGDARMVSEECANLT